jgi:hypothetical protein
MEVIRTLVEVCGEQSGVNDTWIWIFESNEQNWSGDQALILTDREITEFIRLSTGKRSQVFEHVSMVRGRLHRGLLFTKGGRDSFDAGSSRSYRRDKNGNVTGLESKTRIRAMECAR